MDEMRTSDPNAALRESALPTLLTYSGSEGHFKQHHPGRNDRRRGGSLPDGQVVLDPPLRPAATTISAMTPPRRRP